uniref:Uncharacterized protein n=1 Tax=Romanomermis culicivorax TaxID=13658 RepID=A0A915KF76_ROMCU
RAFFLELLNTRLQSINLFEFGRVDFLVYVSASKYTVLDPACPTLFSRCKARRNMYSTFFDTKLIDKTKFDDQTATPGKSFTVDVNPEKGLYAQFLKKNCVDIDSAYLLHLKPKLDLHVPLISSARQQHDQTQLYKHFEYFNRQINLNMKNLADFLGNFFAGSEEILLNCEGDVSSRDNFLKRKCKSLNLDEEIQLFNRLRSWDGYEHCAFVHEAGKFVESSVLAVNDI